MSFLKWVVQSLSVISLQILSLSFFAALIDELRRNPCESEETRDNFEYCCYSDCMRMKKEHIGDHVRSRSPSGEGSMTYTKEQLQGVQR